MRPVYIFLTSELWVLWMGFTVKPWCKKSMVILFISIYSSGWYTAVFYGGLQLLWINSTFYSFPATPFSVENRNSFPLPLNALCWSLMLFRQIKIEVDLFGPTISNRVVGILPWSYKWAQLVKLFFPSVPMILINKDVLQKSFKSSWYLG